MPLPLRGPQERGPWGCVALHVGGPFDPCERPPEVDGWLLAAPGIRGSLPGSVKEDDGPREAPFVARACPPAWPGSVPDEAAGAPAGDRAALGQAREDVLLASCYASGLALAERAGVACLGVASLGAADPDFPFPVERAAKIALGHAVGHLTRRPPPAHPQRVVFFVSEEEAAVYRQLIATRSEWAAGRRRA